MTTDAAAMDDWSEDYGDSFECDSESFSGDDAVLTATDQSPKAAPWEYAFSLKDRGRNVVVIFTAAGETSLVKEVIIPAQLFQKYPVLTTHLKSLHTEAIAEKPVLKKLTAAYKLTPSRSITKIYTLSKDALNFPLSEEARVCYRTLCVKTTLGSYDQEILQRNPELNLGLHAFVECIAEQFKKA